MQAIATVTQKGQVTIPKELRDFFSISSYDSVLIEKHDDHISIKPTKNLIDFIGKIVPRKNKKTTPTQARKQMEKTYQRF